MSPRTLILLSPFVLAVILGKLATPPERPEGPELGPMTDFSLDRYTWQRRPLILFAPSDSDPSYLQTMLVLGRNVPSIEERQIVLVQAFERGSGLAEGRRIPERAAAELRERFAPEPGALTIVLVGKDGTEKRRWQELPPLIEIFETIDAMPMRQQEIRDARAGDPD